MESYGPTSKLNDKTSHMTCILGLNMTSTSEVGCVLACWLIHPHNMQFIMLLSLWLPLTDEQMKDVDVSVAIHNDVEL